MDNELYHYGVLGMKWGVRRYQPYGEGGYNPKSGSLTKRGLGHFRDSERRYDEANSKYKELKKNKKKNLSSAKTDNDRLKVKQDLHKAKIDRKVAEKNLRRNYKQVKKDYLADQGKDLYRSGKTITGNNTNYKLAGLIASGAGLTYKALRDNGNDKYANYALYAAAGLEVVNAAIGIKNSVQNRKLRAYYGHSGKYY